MFNILRRTKASTREVVWRPLFIRTLLIFSHKLIVSKRINYHFIAADDIQSQAQGFERIEQESDESVSDDTNSQGVEASDHDVLSEEVAYSHISETDNEEDQEEDAIEKKQTSFNV